MEVGGPLWGLIHWRDDQWRLYWLESDEVRHPSIWRYLFSNGKAEIDIPPENRAVIPSAKFLEQLGYLEAKHQNFLERDAKVRKAATIEKPSQPIP